jgi:hypothetical protein
MGQRAGQYFAWPSTNFRGHTHLHRRGRRFGIFYQYLDVLDSGSQVFLNLLKT